MRRSYTSTAHLLIGLVMSPFLLVNIYSGFNSTENLTAKWQLAQLAKRAKTWPTTQGVIKQAGVTLAHKTGRLFVRTAHRPDIRYEYTVDDQRYTSNYPWFGSEYTYPIRHTASWRGSLSSGRNGLLLAQHIADSYHPGKAVTVYYDPDRPSRAIIEQDSPGGFLFIFFATIGLSAVLGIWFIWCLRTLLGRFFGH